MSRTGAEGGAGRHEEPILGIPNGRALRVNILLSTAFTAFFWAVYWTGDWVAGRAPHRFEVALPIDMAIPFVPWTAVVYLTITPLLWLAPFIFRSPSGLLPLVVTMSLEVALAGVAFCLYPVALSFPSHNVEGAAGFVYRLARHISLTYNCVPSLHVAFAVSAAWAYRRPLKGHWNILIMLWTSAIIASTMLSHLHHVLDVITGALLGVGAMAWVHPRVCSWVAHRAPPCVARDGASCRRRSQ
ncbi:MAG: phosphatase PAP2 family protein [Acetobacteraceae bacterium]|nr:phosphatase PAP2 family protein [Acetobacteraceae bacterium]